MKVRSITAILTTVTCLAVAAALPVRGDAPAPAEPKLRITTAAHDFGTLQQGDRATHEFEIRNEGAADLVVSEAAAIPAGVSVTFDKVVPPGGSGKVRVVLDSSDIVGAVRGLVRVSSNDPAQAVAVLQIYATVTTAVRAHPGYARFISVQHEREGTITQTLWTVDALDLQVLDVEAPPPLRASFREAKPEERRAEGTGRQWRVETILPADAPVGALQGYVAVHTNHPREKLVKIPVSGFVRPVFAITPPRGVLGEVTLTAPRSFTFKVRNFATEPIELTGVDTPVAGVDAAITAVEAGRRYDLVVTLSPELPKGSFSTTLKIHTASPKAPVLQLDLEAQIL